jgi:hypothetical protein
MLNRINLITDSRIKREKESTFGIIATLTLESILEEIWYGSRGIHLIDAPIHILTEIWWIRSEPFIT